MVTDELWEQAAVSDAGICIRVVVANLVGVAVVSLEVAVIGVPGARPGGRFHGAFKATEAAVLDAGVGVSSGTVVAGNIGAENRYEYTVIGTPVNEAARLTEEAKFHAGRVLATGAAVEAAASERAHLARLRPEDAPRQVERHPDLRTVSPPQQRAG